MTEKRKTKGYVNRSNTNGFIYVHLNDKELCDSLRLYGKRVNSNMESLIKKLIVSDKSIYTLIDELDREQYELLDEDAKVDIILKMKKRIELLEAKVNVPRGTISGGREDA